MRKCVIFVFCLLVAICAAAQSEVMLFSRLVQDPASEGMAGAGYVSESGAAFAALGSSAAPALSDKKLDAALGYRRQSLSGDNFLSAGAFFAATKLVRLNAAVVYSFGQNYDIYDNSGKLCGEFMPSAVTAALGASFRFNSHFGAGVNARFYLHTLSPSRSYTAFAGDVYAGCSFGGLRAAVAAVNIGTPVTAASGSSHPLPSSVKGAVGYDVKAGIFDFGVYADADYFISSGFAASVGASACVAGIATLRGGYHHGGATAVPSHASVGLGLSFKGFRIDASYVIAVLRDTAPNALCAGLGYTF